MTWPAERVRNTFRYHNPADLKTEEEIRETIAAYEEIRAAGGDLCEVLLKHVPETAEGTRAMNRIQEAIHLANAAIAIYGHRNHRKG